MSRASVRLAALALDSVAAAAGCGSGAEVRPVPAAQHAATTPRSSAPSTPLLPVTVTDVAGRQVTVNDVGRAVVLNSDIAEIVFALGLGPNVVATDISATYPAEAKSLPKIGYQRTLNAEGILPQRPSLVLGDEAAGPPAVRVAVMDAGRLVSIGPPAEVLTAELLSTVYGHPVTVVAHPQRNCPLVLTDASTTPVPAGVSAESGDG